MESNGQRSNTVRVAVSASLPEIRAIANQDGTPNSATNPAQQGSAIMVYMSGMGQTNPASVDVVPVNAFVGGISSPPQYVGAAMGLVAGITQVNVRIPTNNCTSDTSSVSVNSAFATLYIVQSAEPLS